MNSITTAHEMGHALDMPHPFEVPGNMDCLQGLTNRGIMCYEERKFFFAQSSVNAALNFIRQYGSCLVDDYANGSRSDWVKTWDNYLDESWIGTWRTDEKDHIISGDFDGDGEDELMCIGTGNWATMLDYTCKNGSDWIHKWSNMGSRWIGNWCINAGDKFVVGDFDGDGKADLLCFSANSAWSHLLSFNDGNHTYPWTLRWSNHGGGWLSSWKIITPLDKYIVGDFNGDGKDELLCMSTLTGNAMLFAFNGTNFTLKWHNNNSGSIGGVAVQGALTRYTPGKYISTTQDELLTWVSNWVTVLRWNEASASWDWIWSQYGSGLFAGIPSLSNANRHLLSGNLDNDIQDEIFYADAQLAATIDWHGNDFYYNWHNGGTRYFVDFDMLVSDYERKKYNILRPTLQNNEQILAFTFFNNKKNRLKEATKISMYRSVGSSQKSMGRDASQTQTEVLDTLPKFLLYPNPTHDIVYLLVAPQVNIVDLYCSVCDVTGKEVLKQPLLSTRTELNLSNLGKGFYFVRIKDNYGVIATHKIVLH